METQICILYKYQQYCTDKNEIFDRSISLILHLNLARILLYLFDMHKYFLIAQPNNIICQIMNFEKRKLSKWGRYRSCKLRFLIGRFNNGRRAQALARPF